MWAGTGTGGDALAEIAQGFGEELGVDVKVELVPGDQLQSSFVTASQGNNAPDVVCGAHDWIGNLVQNGTIDPIQLVGPDAAQLQELAVQAVTYNNQVYGMPFTMNSIVLYRNTDLVPEAPATMEELIATGEQLVAAGQVTEVLAYPVGPTGNPYFINPLYTAGGGYIFGTDAEGNFDPADLGLSQPGAVESYTRIGALGETGQNVLKRSISGDNALSLFSEGQSAFVVEGPWQLPNLAKGTIPYAISPVPGYEGGPAASPFITVDACYVASKGENKVLGQEFVTDFWGRTDVQLAYQEAADSVPASTAVLEEISATAPDIVAVADAAAASGQIMPSIPEMAAVWDPLGKAQAAIIAGADPQTTITQAASTIEAAIGG
ncbi:hypothetical protein ASE38_01655 [Cellulomonas sp. Root930]|nr:hypothetical protein ASE38_01655 [Cellulomonas sp. Root930]